MIANSVTDRHRQRYRDDGVAVVRGAIGAEWIDELRRAVDGNVRSPSERGRIWSQAEDGQRTVYDSQCWRDIATYERFVRDSPLGGLCGRLMGVEAVNFFFDAIFVRSAGTQFRTPFHQDEPYWSVRGFDCCSAWLPLDPVERRSCLEFVRGSHRWTQRFRQQDFGELTGDDRDHVVGADDSVPFPDIDAERERYDILGWDLEPGDVVVFNARMIHGGSGLLAADRQLRVFNTQWLGDDARVCFRPEGMDPDHESLMRSIGLAPGDRVGGDWYPEIWRRSAGVQADR